MGKSSNKNQLLKSLKLKGKENYVTWKEAIINLASLNNLHYHIHKKGRAPEYVNKFSDKVDSDKLRTWLEWDLGDLSIRIIIKLNVKQTPA